MSYAAAAVTGETGRHLIAGFDVSNLRAVEPGENKKPVWGEHIFSKREQRLVDIGGNYSLGGQLSIIATSLMNKGVPWSDEATIVHFMDKKTKRTELWYKGTRYRCSRHVIYSKPEAEKDDDNE